MTDPTSISVIIASSIPGISRTLRMALRGMGVRRIFIADGYQQLAEGFTVGEPQAVLVYVDNEAETDEGLQILRCIRRSPESQHTQIPVIAVSPRRDLPTINAVINGGGHEYVLFPASGEALVRKIIAACTTTRPFIDTEAYVGPARKVDLDNRTQFAAEAAPPEKAAAGQ